MSLDAVPGWISVAMLPRNSLARPLRLKTPARDAHRTPPFHELARTEKEILYGIDDRHLDFRLVLRIVDGSATFASRCRSTTPSAGPTGRWSAGSIRRW